MPAACWRDEKVFRVKKFDMRQLTRRFRQSETGSVTTDWIVLTAGLMLMSALVMAAIGGGTTTVTDSLNTTLSAQAPGG